jgi:hypothetical protein
VPQLPTVGGDNGTWGQKLNDFLAAEFHNDSNNPNDPNNGKLKLRTDGSLPASAIAFTPAGSIGSSNVQAAIAEVATEASATTTALDTRVSTLEGGGNVGGSSTAPTPGLMGTRAVALGERFGASLPPDWAGQNDARSDGVSTTHISRLIYRVCARTTSVRLYYANNRGTQPIEIGCAIDLTYSAEYGGDTRVQGSFYGQRTITLEPGCEVLSDPITIPLTDANSQIGVVTALKIAAGGKWEFNHFRFVARDPWEGAPGGDGGINGTDSDWGAFKAILKTGGVPLSAQPFYGPVALLYEPAERVVAISAVGDSILGGGTTPQIERCFLQIATEGQFSCYIAPVGGKTAASLVSTDPQSKWPYAMHALSMGNHRLSEHGTNDIYNDGVTAAQLEARWIALWFRMRDAGGAKVHQTTITPHTDPGNTTPANGNAVRVAANDWLRAGAPIDPNTYAAVAIGTSGALLMGSAPGGSPLHPLWAIHDCADAVESSRNSGLFKDGYPQDGLHLTLAGHTGMAQGINTSLFI